MDGHAEFKSLTPPDKEFTVKVDLGAQIDKFAWPTSDAATLETKAVVPGGTDKFFAFSVRRVAPLKVLVKRSDTGALIKGAKIEVEGVTGTKDSLETGPVPFEKLKEAKYKVKLLSLADADKPKFQVDDVAENALQHRTPDAGGYQEYDLDPKKPENKVEFTITPVIRVYLKPQFKDPESTDADEKTMRPFPAGFTCLMHTTGDVPKDTTSRKLIVRSDGLLAAADAADLPYVELKKSGTLKTFKLDFNQAEVMLIKCEKFGDATKKQELVKGADLIRDDLTAYRAFMVPTGPWTLKNSDWKVTDAAAFYKADKWEFADLEKPETIAVGSGSAPVKLTLDPHWQFLRFEFMDRFYGHKEHADKTVSIPPVEISGFREFPGKAKVDTARTKESLAAAAEAVIFQKQAALWEAEDANDKATSAKAFADYIADYWTTRVTDLTAARAVLTSWFATNNAYILANPADPVVVAENANLAKANADLAAANTEKAKAVTEKAAKDAIATPAAAALAAATTALVTATTALGTKRTDADAARGEADAAVAAAKLDTQSNWILEPGSKSENRVQCLPWIISKKDDGTAALKPDELSLIEFTAPANSYVHSKSATERVLVKLDPVTDIAKLKPGVDRLQYYDLPVKWKSQKYFARIPGAGAAAAKKNRFEQLAKEATKPGEPLTFCLDDLVLTEEDGTPLPDYEWSPDKRVALFCNRFSKKKHDGTADVKLTTEGLYDQDDTAHLSYLTKKPVGATAAGAAGTDTVEKNRNYIADYPKWTRLAIANGTLFDVFERRTKDSVVGVVGARAAVRYVDPTRPIPGVTLELNKFNPVTKAWEDIAHTNQRPVPNKTFKTRPGMVKKSYFAVQAYYEARYGVRYTEPFDEAKDEGTGRVDMALIRCCSVSGAGATAKERVVNLHFIRNYFEFIGPALSGKSITDQETWKDTWTKNVIARWNGSEDGTSRTPNSSGRAKILPRAVGAATPPAMEIEVLWFGQCLPQHQSHFHVRVEDKGANSRDNRGGSNGTGESSPEGYRDSDSTNGFASAHESGHADSLPDEYNERWDGASYGQISMKSNLPGDPYELDGRFVEYQQLDTGMMNGNRLLRNRYFWNSAEWSRVVLGEDPFKAAVDLKVAYGTYTDYWVPPHDDAVHGRTYTYWPTRYSLDHTKPATRCETDLYLVTYGEDHYSKVILKTYQSATATAKYDGVLVVAVKVKITLPPLPNGPGGNLHQNRKKLLQAMTAATAELNKKFVLKGKVRPGTPHEWTFQRCLIFFSPRYVVIGAMDNAGNVVTGASGADEIASIFKPPFEVVISENATAVTTSEWEAADPKPEIMKKTGADSWDTETTGLAIPKKADVGTAITDYHALPSADLKARMAKLEEIITLVTPLPVETVNLDHALWITLTDIPGRSRGTKGELQEVDNAVTNYVSISAEKYGERITQLEEIQRRCGVYDTVHMAMNRLAHPRARDRIDKVKAFNTEVGRKIADLKLIKPPALLKMQAENRKGYLERMHDSKKLLIKYAHGSDPATTDDVHDEFIKRFPEMLGIPKSVKDVATPANVVTFAEIAEMLGKTSANAIPNFGMTDASVINA